MKAPNESMIQFSNKLKTNFKSRISGHWFIPAALAAIVFLLIGNIYTYYPDGWDQTEYSFNIRNNYLPHGPYLVHFLLGKILSLIWQPSESLSVISLLAGSFNIFVFYKISEAFIKKTYEDNRNMLFPTVASMLLGGSSLYLLNGGSQEVYMLQLFFVLASIYFIYVERNLILAGLLCGLAYGTHNGAVFLLPAMLYLIWATSENRKGMIKDEFTFLTCAFAAVALVYSYFIATIAITGDEIANWSGTKFSDFNGYLGGIAPRPSFEKLIDLKLNILNLVKNINQFDYKILGYSNFIKYPFYLGILVLAFKQIKVFIFLTLYSFFYFYYEAIVGNLDTGLYVVFLIGVIAVSIAYLIDFLRRHSKFSLIILPIFFIIGLAPGYLVFKERVHAVSSYLFLRHFGPMEVSVIWANSILPEHSILVTSPHSSLLPYYITRIKHLNWKYMQSRRSGGLYTPVTASYEIGEEKLISLVRNGYKLYSLADRDALLKGYNSKNEKDINWNKFNFVPAKIQPSLDQALTLLDVPAKHKSKIESEIKVINIKLYEVSLIE
jgi:hypothetical protein